MPGEDTSVVPNASVANAVEVKLPAFMETAAFSWFTIAEGIFEMHKITSPKSQFFKVITLLPSDILCRIPREIYESKDYKLLKEHVSEYFEKSKPELFEKLISGTSMTGKPSEFLLELENIGTKVGVGSELIKHKFLQSLPRSIAPVLISRQDISLRELGRLADDMMIYSRERCSEISQIDVFSTTARNSRGTIDNQTADRRRVFSSTDKETQIPVGVRPYKNGQKPRICRSHIYYADHARYCKPWCKYPKRPGISMQPNSRSSSPSPSLNSEN